MLEVFFLSYLFTFVFFEVFQLENFFLLLLDFRLKIENLLCEICLRIDLLFISRFLCKDHHFRQLFLQKGVPLSNLFYFLTQKMIVSFELLQLKFYFQSFRDFPPQINVIFMMKIPFIFEFLNLKLSSFEIVSYLLACLNFLNQILFFVFRNLQIFT